MPRKVARGALRAALTQKLTEGVVTVVDALAVEEVKTKPAVALLQTLGATSRTLIVDVHPDDKLILSTRNIVGVTLRPSNQVSARDVIQSTRIIATRAAMERLAEVLG